MAYDCTMLTFLLHSDELALSMVYDFLFVGKDLLCPWLMTYDAKDLHSLCPWLMTYDANLFVGKDLHSDELALSMTYDL